MAQIIDEDGLWEVIEGIGCVNRLLLEPSEKYVTDHAKEGD